MTAALYSLPSAVEAQPGLSRDLCLELWSRVLERLKQGEVLITNQDFQEAMGVEYRDLTGAAPAPEIQQRLSQIVSAVNAAYPETYVTRGVQNSVNRAFAAGVRALKWDEAKIQAKGVPAVRRFHRQGSIRDLFKVMRVRGQQINVFSCVQHAIEVLEKQQGPALSRSVPTAPAAVPWNPVPPPLAPAPEPPPVVSPEEDASPAFEPEIQAVVDAGEIDREEADRRVQQQERRRVVLEARELESVPRNLPAYVDQGLLTKTEADQVRALRQVDDQVEQQAIEVSQAEVMRDDILDREGRNTLQQKVSNAAAETVNYLQVFEGLKKIHPQYDEVMRYLIRHKDHVADDTADDRTPAIRGLLEDAGLLGRIVELTERKDPEVRLLDVRLPPYRKIAAAHLEKIDNLTIEESFVDDLRKISTEEMSERLNAPQAEMRARPAADMCCFIHLIDHVVKRTQFRKKVRLLKVGQTLQAFTPKIEEFYRAAVDLRTGRQKAQQFLKGRVERLFPDLSNDESREIDRRSNAVLTMIEQKMLDAPHRNVEETPPPPVDNKAEGELTLTEEEQQQGVQIGRVEMRVAGRNKRIPQKIMPDLDDPGQFVIVKRDPDSGELVPQMRGGAKRIVKKGRDGTWEVV